jgi:hypothetical protein
MNILRRGATAAEASSKESFPEPAKNQRIEITVERETVTMLVRGQTVENQQAPALESVAPEPERLELSPSAGALPDKDCTYNSFLRPISQLDRRVLHEAPMTVTQPSSPGGIP